MTARIMAVVAGVLIIAVLIRVGYRMSQAKKASKHK